MRPAALLSFVAATRRRITPTGSGLASLALSSAVLGERYHWTELSHLAAGICGVLVLGLLSVLLSRRATVEAQLRPTRLTVGEHADAHVEVRAGRLPLVAPMLVVPAGGTESSVRPGLVTAGRPVDVVVDVPTEKRGVLSVGPVIHASSDLFGAFRRHRAVAPAMLLHVRPVIVPLPSLAAGIVHDLEGVASDRLAASDLSFHALREYVPGDDPRHVHWKSTARAGSLLVRQFQLTRHSHATVVLDPEGASYAGPEEFELAVSAAASVAVRAAQDGFEVAFACGDVALVSSEASRLLDLACRFEVGPSDLPQTCARLAGGLSGSSLVVTVTGSRAQDAAVRHARSHFPVSADVLSLRAEQGAEPHGARSGATTAVVVGDLDQLATLLARTR